jgi:hypothetical protein
VNGSRFQFLFCVFGLGLLASLIGAFTEVTVATEAVARAAALDAHTRLSMSLLFGSSGGGGGAAHDGDDFAHRAQRSLHRSLTLSPAAEKRLTHAADGARAVLGELESHAHSFMHTLSHAHPHPRSSSDGSERSHAAAPTHAALQNAPRSLLEPQSHGRAAAPVPPVADMQAPPRLELLQQQPGANRHRSATPPPGPSSGPSSDDDDGIAAVRAPPPLPRAPPPLPLPPADRRALHSVERPPSASPPWFVAQPTAGADAMPFLELPPAAAAPPSAGLAPLAFMVRGADERARARADRAVRVAARRQELAASAEQDAAHVAAAQRTRRMPSPADWSDA